MAKQQKCPHCGFANASGAGFCGRCGRSLAVEPPKPQAAAGPAGPKCPHCGSTNPPGAAFCHACGGTMAAQKPEKKGEKGGRGGVLLGLLAVLLLVGGAAGGMWWWLGQDETEPQATVVLAGNPTAGAGDTQTPSPGDTATAEIPSPSAGAPTATDEPPTAAAPTADSPTPAPTDTPAPTETPAPTDTPPPPPTPTPPPAGGDFFTQNAARGWNVVNQPWVQDGVALTVRAVDVRTIDDWDDAAVQVWFRMVNQTGERILIEIDWNAIRVEDSFGTPYVDYYGGGTTSEWVEPGDTYDFDRYYSTFIEQPSRVPGNATHVKIIVDQFSRVINAVWQLDINPTPVLLAGPPPAGAKAVGDSWAREGLSLQLTELSVRAESDYEDAAAFARFTLTNASNQAAVVQIDFGSIYLLDGFGRRYGDWEGGGIVTQTIEPGRSYDFNRYFNDMSRFFGRVTRSSPYVVLVVDNTAGMDFAYWQAGIDNRLSAAVTPVAPLRVNQSWEQDGLSLTVRRVEIRGADDYDDAAAQVWYRLVNKTGGWFLVAVDWSTIHLEDSQGTRYGDYYGPQTTSFWIAPGGYIDFDRYYSTIVEQESRVPAGVTHVTVVVDSFARITNARWQVNLVPSPLVVAADATGLTVGEGWERDGVVFRLAEIEVRTESDYDDAAFWARFEVINTTNLPVLAEIDFSHIAIVDSMGGHFGDWDGGGILSRWILPGETMDFSRYYSEMSGMTSRIARGSAFVLVTFNNVAGIESGVWRLDIVR